MTPREQTALLSTVSAARQRTYLLALTTGLRRGELAALAAEPGRLDLAAGVVRLRPEETKNREETCLPVPEPVLRLLRGAGLSLDIPTMKDWHRDLLNAGIEYETSEGVADFHALRVTFATNLARAGVPLVVAQKLMRHSDPKLTSNVYSRFGTAEVREALSRVVPAIIPATVPDTKEEEVVLV